MDSSTRENQASGSQTGPRPLSGLNLTENPISFLEFDSSYPLADTDSSDSEMADALEEDGGGVSIGPYLDVAEGTDIDAIAQPPDCTTSGREDESSVSGDSNGDERLGPPEGEVLSDDDDPAYAVDFNYPVMPDPVHGDYNYYSDDEEMNGGDDMNMNIMDHVSASLGSGQASKSQSWSWKEVVG